MGGDESGKGREIEVDFPLLFNPSFTTDPHFQKKWGSSLTLVVGKVGTGLNV